MSDDNTKMKASDDTTKWYNKFWNFISTAFREAFKKLYEITMPAVRDVILDFLNDRDLQEKAMHAVRVAIDKGLRSDEAWKIARGDFVSQLQAAGREASSTLIDTMLQNAYCSVKYAVNRALDDDENADPCRSDVDGEDIPDCKG